VTAAAKRWPQSLESERALLGGLLWASDELAVVSEVLRREDFYGAAHRHLWDLLLELARDGRPFDVLMVTEAVIARDPQRYGGIAYVSGLPEHCASPTNLGHYAEIVRDRAVRRRLLEASGRIVELATDASRDLDDVLQDCQSLVFALSACGATKTWVEMDELMVDEMEAIGERSDNPGLSGVTTGFVDLDEQLGGLHPTDLVILAGRPAMGKTALALNIAQRTAMAGTGVGVFSLEMGGRQLAGRHLGSSAMVPGTRLRSGRLAGSDWHRLEDAHARLHGLPVWVDDTAGLDLRQVQGRARRLKAEHPELKLLIVDYLQLMVTKGRSREQEISEISRSLKHLAKELEITVLALSQLNRGVEQRKDKRPMLSDLRESGAIEQDADVILFVYRDAYYNLETADPAVAEIIIAKQRSGPTGTVKLHWDGHLTRFENLAVGHEYA
jgi:replicative DNA helicase